MMTLYGIKNCDTVKKARTWLEKNGKAYRFHDYRTDGLPPELLKQFAEELGWEKLLNRSSASWRQLSHEQQADLTEDKAMGLMLATPTLIKRPILNTGGRLIIGFKVETYQSHL
ncbi:MAG: ArsC family reductase [Gammaproteobacteria bacterium]